MSVNIRVEVPGRCKLRFSDLSEPSLQVHLSRANNSISRLRVVMVRCYFSVPLVDTLSKSECLKQSLQHYGCDYPRGQVVCLVTAKAVWTLSLLCMVRRKTPCKLVALTVCHTSCVRVHQRARNDMKGMDRRHWYCEARGEIL